MGATGSGAAAASRSGAEASTGTAQRPMRADARRNCERLLTAAAAAFADRGSDDVSLEEIARRAGVGIGTLYRHFPSRQALLEQVYRDQVEILSARSDQLMDTPSSAAALVEWLRALSAFALTKRSMNRTLLEALGKESELFSTCGAMLRAASTQLVERAQQAGVVRPEIVPTDVLRLVHALVVAADAAPGDTGQADRMLSIVLAGILIEPGSAEAAIAEAAQLASAQ
jgi:AcrR family transcriptional regulator